MFFSSAVVLPILLPAASLVAATSLQQRADCKDVHLFLARGNGEAYPGRVGAISDTVCSGLPSCDYENIEFNSQQGYCAQAQDGAAAGVRQVEAYASRCPNSKLVLAGYSLGAHIVGDVLGGGGGHFYDCAENSNTGLSASSAGSHIAAVLMFGDVRHVANQGYNYGPGSGMNGQYPRSGSQLSNLNQFGPVMRSYCLATDPICALGNDGLSHETYMDVYANNAALWAQGVLGFAEPGASHVVAPTSSPTPTVQQSTSAPATTDAPISSADSFDSSSGSSTDYFPSGSSSDSSSDSSSPSSSSAEDSSASSSSVEVSSTTSSEASSTTQPPVNTSAFKPFVFSSATSSWKSTSLHSSTLSTISLTKVLTPTFSTTPPATASVAPQATSSSSAGAYANGAQLTLSFISLVVIKVLAI